MSFSISSLKKSSSFLSSPGKQSNFSLSAIMVRHRDQIANFLIIETSLADLVDEVRSRIEWKMWSSLNGVFSFSFEDGLELRFVSRIYLYGVTLGLSRAEEEADFVA